MNCLSLLVDKDGNLLKPKRDITDKMDSLLKVNSHRYNLHLNLTDGIYHWIRMGNGDWEHSLALWKKLWSAG